MPDCGAPDTRRPTTAPLRKDPPMSIRVVIAEDEAIIRLDLR